ncbi:sigma-70 family RNA polymerase sigma factor [Nocardiopsis ganjiahuensis]|uniref:sigma-70 family RNA polymerase sigma factor n=1 Tax=Nocardiopsis ganjiahuensis TaxID=239984 RepID=UPI0003472472|nr:sigma-70 family RNA polymerase sigma factor [Nocardiopsis ganjiahuensis]
MCEKNFPTEGFEAHRPRLCAMAYRMLGSLSEADDAVQEAWIRYGRTDTEEIRNLSGWLTTVLSRICLNVLRSRENRREEPFGVHVPDPVVSPESGTDPEREALISDEVGLALMVVLDSLSPAERLAFVLHDLFAVPFDGIAPLVERSTEATRKLASRARGRVRGSAPVPDRALPVQRAVVDAFFAAAREGEFDALLALLDPDVVLRGDGGAARAALTVSLRGARAVSGQAASFRGTGLVVLPVLVNGAAGVVVLAGGRPRSVMAFTVTGGRIAAIDVLADPDRLAALGLDRIPGPEGTGPPA